MQTQTKETKKMRYNEGLIVSIKSKEVNFSHIMRAKEQCPEKIVFTKNVKKITQLAFKDVDCDRFDFSTAVNLRRIAAKAFKNAKNVHWCEVLANADQEDNSFEDAHVINKNTEVLL